MSADFIAYDELAEFNQEKYDYILAQIKWKNCAEPKCPYKICTWASETLCWEHETKLVGEVEMKRRYDLTHEHPHSYTGHTNYMTKAYKEIKDEKGTKGPV